MQRTITGISFLMSNPGITDPVFQFIWLIIRESRFSPFWSIVKIERRLWILIVSGAGDRWRRRRPATPSPPTSISRRRSWGSCAISFSTRTSPYRSDFGHSSPSATSRAKAPAMLSLSVIFYLFSFCLLFFDWLVGDGNIRARENFCRFNDSEWGCFDFSYVWLMQLVVLLGYRLFHLIKCGSVWILNVI